MSKFATKLFETVKGKQVFKKLLVNGVCLIDKFEFEIKLNKQYYSELKIIYAYMNFVANGVSLPKTKFREIKTGKTLVKRYEFKSKHLRIYILDIPGGKIIIMGGFKNNQKKDIRKFLSLTEEYLNKLI